MSHTITRRPARGRLLALLAGAATLLAAACSSTTAATQPVASTAVPATSAAPSTAASTSAAAGTSSNPVTELKTASTSLGDVLVDEKGMVLYMYTKDTQGAQQSVCSGGCAAIWPAAHADAVPTLTGVTGTVTLISTPSGAKQLAINGWPLYYYAQDKAPGDVHGQGVGSVWYVLDASGTPKKA